MSKRRASRRQIVVPSGLSDEEIDSSESEDEISEVTQALQRELTVSENSSLDEETDESDGVEVLDNDISNSKKNTLDEKKFVTSVATFGGELPEPPTDIELEPVDYFISMFGRESVGLLTDQSNLYSVQKDSNKPVRVSEMEIKRFINVPIMTDVYSFPEQRFFWTSPIRVESISSVMSRDRFLEIKKNLHAVDNSTQLRSTDPNYDCAYKIRSLMNIIRQNFRKVPKEEKLSVDEQIIPFKVGTVRPNHLSDLVMKDKKELSREGRGPMDHRVAEVDGVELCATRWYDNNVVNCLSTLHGCDPTDLAKRWSSKKKNHVHVSRPFVIKDYNENMGSVDLLDMLISLYRINVRSTKYYMKIIFHLIDLSLVNAWLLYRRHCSQHQVQKKNILSLLTFRIDVGKALLKASLAPPPVRRGRPSLDAVSNEDHAATTIRATPVPTPPTSTRVDKFNH